MYCSSPSRVGTTLVSPMVASCARKRSASATPLKAPVWMKKRAGSSTGIALAGLVAAVAGAEVSTTGNAATGVALAGLVSNGADADGTLVAAAAWPFVTETAAAGPELCGTGATTDVAAWLGESRLVVAGLIGVMLTGAAVAGTAG